ncbi:MAG TPA: PilZ domain-containing protein [Tepidisphaeraceae bacterium]|jgi:hypothetical protein
MLAIAQNEADVSRGSVEAVPAERRRGLRIRQNRPVKVYEPMAARFFAGQTSDISSTGLRIELPASMPVMDGKVIHIHVGLNEKGQALVNRRGMMPARVVWIDRSITDGRPRLLAGVEFVASITAHLDAA